LGAGNWVGAETRVGYCPMLVLKEYRGILSPETRLILVDCDGTYSGERHELAFSGGPLVPSRMKFEVPSPGILPPLQMDLSI
jgi:hypothetical protein